MSVVSAPPSAWLARYRAMPERARMVTTAVLGALTGLVTYEALFWLNPFEPRATTAWVASFLLGVTRQHGLHRMLTFERPGPYWPSLGRAYVMYTGSLVAGSALNWTLTEALGVNHRVAWGCCLVSTATISLVFLKGFVFAAGRGD